jgi:large subunit ribosomal protein L29
MKAKELRERSTEDLVELRALMKKDLFGYRMRNHTGQLDDNSLIRKSRRDIARVEHILHERATAAAQSKAAADGGNE